jgi:hypothetical protein
MKSFAMVGFSVASGLWVSACLDVQDNASTSTPVVVERPFVSDGHVEMQLDGGNYEIRPAVDNRVRVTLRGHVGQAKAEIAVDGAEGHVVVQDTPHNNFQATIEVPSRTDLVVHLKGGNLSLAGIAGNKDVESAAGNTGIRVGDPNDYARVDASVKAGNIDTNAFGKSTGGLFPHLSWSGPGKYSLQATLGAGNLELRRQ